MLRIVNGLFLTLSFSFSVLSLSGVLFCLPILVFLSPILKIVVIWVFDLCHCSTLPVYLVFLNKIFYITYQKKKKKKKKFNTLILFYSLILVTLDCKEFFLSLYLLFFRHYMRMHSLCLICVNNGWLSTCNLLLEKITAKRIWFWAKWNFC